MFSLPRIGNGRGVRVWLIWMVLAPLGLWAQEKAAVPPTPEGYPDAETFFYREGENAMRLHVVKPKDWKPGDHRSALVWYFGGGWVKGSTDHSISWARWAAKLGMVGIAPDYRVKDRFNTSPYEAVADARAAYRWVQVHAKELGIDPERIASCGGSAGGHVASWTAIRHTPYGSDPAEAPLSPPAVLVLLSPVSDTTKEKGYAPSRFGEHGLELSTIDQLDAKMPPLLLFHGDADKTVPQAQSIALHEKYVATGNACTFVSVPGGSHNFSGDLPGWKDKTRDMVAAFFKEHGLLPAQK